MYPLHPAALHARLAARDPVGDFGTDLTTPSEMTRTSLADVAAANVRRLQESLRSLEEFGKLIDPTMASRCEQLRYRAYTLQKQLDEAAAALDVDETRSSIAPRLTVDIPAAKLRLDQLLVARGFFESREKAQRAIMAGAVSIGEQPARHASGNRMSLRGSTASASAPPTNAR